MISIEVSTTGFRKIEPEVIKLGEQIENKAMSDIIPIENTDCTAYVEVYRASNTVRAVEMDRRDVDKIKIMLGRAKDRQGNECSTEDSIIIDLANAQIKVAEKSESLTEVSDRYDIQITCEVDTYTKNGEHREFAEGTVYSMEEVGVKHIISLIMKVTKRYLDKKVDLLTIYCGTMEGSVSDKIWISADTESEAWQFMNKKA